ncbi:MAG: NUDIX domain-containing protein [Chromatiales bacterium]|jgi:phosphohistidine phosphatase
MSRELLLLRHGKSDWDSHADDFHRPLKNRGKRGAQRMGVYLMQQNRIPDLIISSPAVRALTTAQKCGKVMGIGARHIQEDKRIYLADPYELLEVLADCPPQAKRVMLVGHNPGLELLLSFLADGPPETPADGKLLPTATLARLGMPDDWRMLKESQARLTEIMRAADLPKKFPFPSIGAEELRDRPAYYYTQSAVIPYRINNNCLEILIISSSKNKHWVVPKGIADPGHSLQESAAKEAFEEAGIEGQVDAKALGNYSYPKWGASCDVTVYPMLVERELTDQQWQEDHRKRQWVSAKQAIKRLKQAELGPMIQALSNQLAVESCPD